MALFSPNLSFAATPLNVSSGHTATVQNNMDAILLWKDGPGATSHGIDTTQGTSSFITFFADTGGITVWTFEKGNMQKGKVADAVSKYHGVGRNHAYFDTYLKGQELIAKQVFDSSKTQNKKPTSSTIEYQYYGRLHDPVPNMKKAQFELALKKANLS
jgi:hypothetical protein